MKYLLFILCLWVMTTQAQMTKTEEALLKANAAKNNAKGALELGKEISGMFGKNKQKTKGPDVVKETTLEKGTKTTMLLVAGLDFSKLKTLNENVKLCSGVQSTTMKYGEPSSIEINHTGTTEALMKLISDVSKDIFTEKNITSFEEGKVTVKI
jgi:hypothetical protein